MLRTRTAERVAGMLSARPSRPAVAAVGRALSSSRSNLSTPRMTPPRHDDGVTGSRKTNTISDSEIAHFSALSAHWWDPTGEFGLLHRMNPSRIEFMRDSLVKVRELPNTNWLRGKRVLDVGCGGGIFAESIARLGAQTLAIDASSANILTAQTHASLDPKLNLVNSPIPRPSHLDVVATESAPTRVAAGSLEYRHCAAEDLVTEGQQFDVVCAMEVIEHVEDPRGFLECLMRLTKPGGHLLISTISRTLVAKFLTITMAEHVLRLVTPGTHTYSKYLRPEEVRDFFEREHGWHDCGFEQRGCVYDPFAGKWRLLGEGEFGGFGELANYFAGIRKPLSSPLDATDEP